MDLGRVIPSFQYNSHQIPTQKQTKETQKTGPCSSMRLMDQKNGSFGCLNICRQQPTSITSFMGRRRQNSSHTGITRTFVGATCPKSLFSYSKDKGIKILFYSLLFKIPSMFLWGWLKTSVIGSFQFSSWARKDKRACGKGRYPSQWPWFPRWLTTQLAKITATRYLKSLSYLSQLGVYIFRSLIINPLYKRSIVQLSYILKNELCTHIEMTTCTNPSLFIRAVVIKGHRLLQKYTQLGLLASNDKYKLQ